MRRPAARLLAVALSALLAAAPSLAAVSLLLAAPAARAEDAFVGNKSSKVFHQADCRLAKSLKAQNRTTFPSAEAAQQAGFKGCKVCKPGGQAQGDKPAKVALVAAQGGDTFHKASCVEAKRIKKKNRRAFATADEAAAAGLKPCKLCKP